MVFDAYTDDNYGGAVWSAIECNVGVICVSLPTFKAFTDRFFPSLMGYSSNRSQDNPQRPFSTGKHGRAQRTIELEHMPSWENSLPNNDGDDYQVITTAIGDLIFHTDNSTEHLRGPNIPVDTAEGIWKSTDVVVSYSAK